MCLKQFAKDPIIATTDAVLLILYPFLGNAAISSLLNSLIFYKSILLFCFFCEGLSFNALNPVYRA